MKILFIKIAYFIVQGGAGGILGTIESLPTHIVRTVDWYLCKKFICEIWNVPEIKKGEIEKKGRERKKKPEPSPHLLCGLPYSREVGRSQLEVV